MPYISTEALVGLGLIGVLAWGWQYLPKATPSTNSASKSKKKNKKKNKATSTDGPELRQDPESRRTDLKEEPKPIAPETGPEQKKDVSAPSKPKTLAEKIAPKPRKTKVDDMLAPEDLPAKHARVMRVIDPSHITPAPGPILPAPSESSASRPAQTKMESFENDYASDSDTPSEKSEAEWNVVAPKPKKPVSLSLSASAAAAPSSTPLPVSTKIQRKNAKKAEAKKAAKAAEETERLRRLAMHKRDLERERINELYTVKKKNGVSAGRATATATVDSRALFHHECMRQSMFQIYQP